MWQWPASRSRSPYQRVTRPFAWFGYRKSVYSRLGRGVRLHLRDGKRALIKSRTERASPTVRGLPSIKGERAGTNGGVVFVLFEVLAQYL